MREIVFQKQNKAKWEKLETTFSQSKSISPDLLAESYIEVINDLSYAKTHYKNSDSHKYLNQLAGKYHQLIYQNKKEKRNRFVKFWTTELPLVVRRNHRFVLLSFLLLSFFTFIGAISAWNDASFVRLILGDSYVDMTLENIKNGRPMDVYGHTREDLMFLMIGLNNVMVAIWSYASGILINFGGGFIIPMPFIGTVYFLFVNGIMLGAFHVMLAQEGVFWEACKSIWLHGTLEILTFIVEFAAGLVVGYSILFPKTYSRLESFKRGAKDGLKIIIGCLPITIFSAAVESYFTRHVPDVHPAISISFISLSLVFMIWYFVIYPIRVEKKLAYAGENH